MLRIKRKGKGKDKMPAEGTDRELPMRASSPRNLETGRGPSVGGKSGISESGEFGAVARKKEKI